MSILSVRQLHIMGKQNHIVKDLSLDVQEGEWFALVGQSGSGKSMTAMAICQLLAPNLQAKGEIWYGEKNLLTLSSSEIRKVRGKRLAYIFQDYQGSFTPFLTIGQHFEEYQRTHLNLSKKARRQQAVNALISVGLNEEIYGRYPFQLSGGQLQRVSISMALLLEPDILIADEPTTALDSVSSFKVLQLLSKLQKETGCAILFITHDLRHVRKYADRIAVMKDGAIIETGDKNQVLNHPQHAYTNELIQSSPSLRRIPFKLEGVSG
ncbi:dipeptide/oligopeptide/nickel ABC transporter ATP-binding protein [Bacillus sp. Soil745]|uniref:ABC transporter ATP-binding protein n=1 Tax=Peribacillus frigoritolerans TaxID=450367 RepID=UPI00070C54AC|nr:ABC transporter ATP-binding protein [Peribacillus frigoritolerans]KRF54685.1 dipeptide/oligopeptide/nickel ABC transporter ATP-binding protein [Bacillus sp. Soil745]MED3891862.1 ABC transporter ATP-binding protein [Peribacillus frigoritolerans]